MQVHVSPICDVLEKTPRISAKWGEIIRELLEPRDRADIEKATNPLYGWLAATLEHWINVKGTAATFDVFQDALKRRRLQDTAGKKCTAT
jgi:hypothetical protein